MWVLKRNFMRQRGGFWERKRRGEVIVKTQKGTNAKCRKREKNTGVIT